MSADQRLFSPISAQVSLEIHKVFLRLPCLICGKTARCPSDNAFSEHA